MIKKFTLLLVLAFAAITAGAKINFDLSKIGAWGGDSGTGVSYDSGTKTLSYTTAWKGAGLWDINDLTGLTHIYIRTSSNCDYVITAQDNSSSNKIVVHAGASTGESIIVFPIPGGNANYGSFGFQATEAGSIVFKEISAINLNADLALSTYVDPNNFYPSSVGGEATGVSSYNSSTKTITIGTFTDPSKWGTAGWWVAGWDSEKSCSTGTDYSAYDKIVVEFASAPTTGGNVTITYGDNNGSQTGSREVSFNPNENQVEIPLNSSLKNGVYSVAIGGPQNATYQLDKVYLSTNKYFPLSEDASTEFSTTTGAIVDLSRTITAGKWSTIVLPFDLPSSQITTVFGAGASVAEFSGGDENELNFTTTLTGDKMKANQPYAIKVASDFSSATFNDVDVESATPTQGTTNWNFVGTYTSGNIPEGSYFFQNNALYYAEGTGNHIKGFRAYFTPKVVATRGSVGFDVDGETTGINSTLYNSIKKGDGKIYSLSGQIVNSPSKGVVYIVNGKKVIF